jgi:catechol 2,3-dioxygenase-like lactoylglutathione lyase family enzyme
MKRMHIHVGVEDLEQSIKFYSALFGATPDKSKTDYAKWMLEDPRINFAISTRAGNTGVDHLGLQVDEDHELSELRERLETAQLSVFDEGETFCCYARSDKSWVEDPSGIAWETFKTMDEMEVFSQASAAEQAAGSAPNINAQPECCAPPKNTSSCCS